MALKLLSHELLQTARPYLLAALVSAGTLTESGSRARPTAPVLIEHLRYRVVPCSTSTATGRAVPAESPLEAHALTLAPTRLTCPFTLGQLVSAAPYGLSYSLTRENIAPDAANIYPDS